MNIDSLYLLLSATDGETPVTMPSLWVFFLKVHQGKSFPSCVAFVQYLITEMRKTTDMLSKRKRPLQLYSLHLTRSS